MRLTNESLQAINTTKSRLTLALALNRTEQRIIYLLKHNPPNSLLTTVTAVRIIQQETGLSENEILTEAVTEAAPQS